MPRCTPKPLLCGCFTGETQVWTDRGIIPIADIVPGDMVIAHDEHSGELSLRKVITTYVRQAAPIVLVAIMSTDPTSGTSLSTLETTEEHPFLVEATANNDLPGWTRADELSPGDTIKIADGTSPGAVVVAIEFTSRRTEVHNLEVEGLHTYLVGEDGVVVHNGIDPFNCWPGLKKQWSKHAPEMEYERMMKAMNTPNGPAQSIWLTTPENVASLIARTVENGKHFNGVVPIPSDWAKAFAAGTGTVLPVSQAKIIWDGSRITNIYPYVP
jgi:hypothetical protein